ncbi:MAG: hypothetical protein LLG15_02035 [Betaproteobacteria bacterium]|nr:hypothetical protein [Betaproteobacteria bacterium]
MNTLLLDWMRACGRDDYGSFITADEVRAVLGIEVPKIGTLADFKKAMLLELAAVSDARQVLIEEGKYLKQDRGDYRILLPGENAKQASEMILKADRRIVKAQKLIRATPTRTEASTHVSAKAEARRMAIRNLSIFGKKPGWANDDNIPGPM